MEKQDEVLEENKEISEAEVAKGKKRFWIGFAAIGMAFVFTDWCSASKQRLPMVRSSHSNRRRRLWHTCAHINFQKLLLCNV